MSFNNPLLHKPARALPRTVAIVGAGTIGPDIGYYLKSAIPDLTLYLLQLHATSPPGAPCSASRSMPRRRSRVAR